MNFYKPQRSLGLPLPSYFQRQPSPTTKDYIPAYISNYPPSSPRSPQNLLQFPSVFPAINSPRSPLTISQSPRVKSDMVRELNFEYFRDAPMFNKGLVQPQLSERHERKREISLQTVLNGAGSYTSRAKEGSLYEISPLLKGKNMKLRVVKSDEKTVSLPSLEKIPRSPQSNLLKTKTVKVNPDKAVFDMDNDDPDFEKKAGPLRKLTKKYIQDSMEKSRIEEESYYVASVKAKDQKKSRTKKKNCKTFQCDLSKIRDKQEVPEIEECVSDRLKRKNQSLLQLLADLSASESD